MAVRARLTTAAAMTAALTVVLVGCGTPTPQTGSPTPPPSQASTTGPSAPASSDPTSATPSPSSTPADPTPSASETTGPTAAPSETETPAPSQTPTPSPSQTQTPTPTTAPAVLKAGDTGDKVRDLQHRLLQLDWFSGKITGEYREATTQAVQGFQAKRKLPDTGQVDQKTLDTLNGMTRKPTDDEKHNRLVAGPALLEKGDKGDKVKDLQARLKQIGWFSEDVTGNYGSVTVSGVKGFQGKREIPVTGEVDQRTQDRLRAMTRTPTKAELNNEKPKVSAAGLDPRCLTGRALCVSKRTNKLVWVIDGKPQLKVDVRFGSYETPTRNGSFTVGWKSRNHVSSIYKTPMPYAMFFSGGQAVHYSSDFAARGYAGASHGCVNVRNKQAITWLFDQVREGDKVIVYS